MKIRPVVAEFHADRHDEANSFFYFFYFYFIYFVWTQIKDQ